MRAYAGSSKAARGWIVTLDVLKYISTAHELSRLDGWIVTLDVLKFPELMAEFKANRLNGNIRSIEMIH